MEKYLGSMRVSAEHMTLSRYSELMGLPVRQGENGAEDGYLLVNHSTHERNVEGYDGYVSWLPARTFHLIYKLDVGGMPFGGAVDALRAGVPVTRSAWGDGVYLTIVLGRRVESEINTREGIPVPSWEFKPVADAIYMKTADGRLVPWTASQTDILTDDWQIVN